MTVRVTTAGTVLRAKLTVKGFGVLAILVFAAVAGCSTASSISSGISSATHQPPTGTSSSATSSTPPTSTATPKPTATVTVTATSAASPAHSPTGAPQTGGGGTAGLQDTMLFGLGGAAILAGAAGIAYRRRLSGGR